MRAPQRAAVGQRGVSLRKLQRSGQIESLSDGNRYGFAHLPRLFHPGQLPALRGNQTLSLMGQLNAGRVAQAEPFRVVRDAIHAQLFPDGVKIDVARLHQRPVQIDRPVPVFSPAAIGPVAQNKRSVAVDPGFGGDHPLFQRRRRHDQLVGRAGRILPGNRPVGHGFQRILLQLFPLFTGNAAVE